MKLLTRSNDTEYLNELKARLESNGIPAVVQGEDTARMLIPRFGFQPTLWVYVDEQFQEALQLIDNPDYKVKAPIDLEAFRKIEPDESEKRAQLNAALLHLMLYLGGVMLVVVAIIWALQ
ncbi:MAG: DUF2007 domain-containing protein [Candidatus Thiodiazotropha sp. 6PLUC4]